ncbi:hypothetical protein DQW50_07310 [Halorubrum sp. 48-1-W]|uniref:hypothetical protein n=1 Tax=Halorubrum sp. 48-1-W TaxID=2249761 RepID=UPI000DCB3583|nr:hypothetical protein [Halorubrum sp. 48-1-W]RAW45814.1 hypothetical protein DQW50_07310 [Halorubrum sp. 48-1-W]
MSRRDWFNDLPEGFEESVRIDSAEDDHRFRAIQSYHVTEDSARFLTDFVNRTLGRADDMRTGSNYWLYGYYGSGKSHLLTVLDGLMDTAWVAGRRETVWSELTPTGGANAELDALRERWEAVHDEYHVVPISMNLLKYQGQKQRSFSEIVLRHAHRNPLLTGVDDAFSEGLSPQIAVAYFEYWYKDEAPWPDRQRRAKSVVDAVTPEDSTYAWEQRSEDDGLWRAVQQYQALSDVVLPELFENVVGSRDGYSDLQPSDIDPETAVARLERLRRERERERDKPVKLVLLLDEVSLFVGTNFERLTELQTLAENVDDIGDGNIQLVATAQAKIEDVQPQFAAHGADFSIVKDRFPHRYQLPSRHVGDIAQRRLFEKTPDGRDTVERILETTSVDPQTSLVYNQAKQNTTPPLDEIDGGELVECYPFLPYHAPLFLEILFNLRKKAPDPAKSIFSGTARAILALMHGLLTEWIETGEEDHVISLVDFYELIRPELREILPKDVRVVEGSKTAPGAVDPDRLHGIADDVDDGSLDEFDLRVAKAVLLLQNVHDIVPMNENNLAVAVMSDLDGRAQITTANRVEESLDRMEKYIRPTDDETGPRYRFATQEERLIYDETETKEANPDWDAVLEALDEHLWADLTTDLSLPESVPYGETTDEYPVAYRFTVDTLDFETRVDAENALGIDVEVQGIHPDADVDRMGENTLYWEIDTEGLDDLRAQLVDWWALRDAVEARDAPPAVERDLEERARSVTRKVVSAMTSGSFAVKDRTDIRGLSTAVKAAVDATYPDDFHPMMLQVSDERLQELANVEGADPLPGWARTVQVPSTNRTEDAGRQPIQNNVLVNTGRQLNGTDDGLALSTVLDEIIDNKPYYSDVRPALRAILWGFCRRGRLLPLDEDGDALADERVLTGPAATIRLKLLEVADPGEALETHGFKRTTETVTTGLINLRRADERLRIRQSNLREDVQLAHENVATDAVSSLLESFLEALTRRRDTTDQRLRTIKDRDDGLLDAIEETKREREWLDDVVETWELRRSTLGRWDAELTLGDSRFDWLEERAVTTIDARRERVAEFDGAWWTADGWSRLVGTLEGDATSDLERSWEAYTDRHDLHALAEDIESNDWIRPLADRPGSARRGFERTYITPLQNVKDWYDSIETAIRPLLNDEETEFEGVTAEIRTLETLDEAVDVPLDDLRGRLEALETVLGDVSPDDVDAVGVVPDDRQSIDERLARLVGSGAVDVEETDTGVVIR